MANKRLGDLLEEKKGDVQNKTTSKGPKYGSYPVAKYEIFVCVDIKDTEKTVVKGDLKQCSAGPNNSKHGCANPKVGVGYI